MLLLLVLGGPRSRRESDSLFPSQLQASRKLLGVFYLPDLCPRGSPSRRKAAKLARSRPVSSASHVSRLRGPVLRRLASLSYQSARASQPAVLLNFADFASG